MNEILEHERKQLPKADKTPPLITKPSASSEIVVYNQSSEPLSNNRFSNPKKDLMNFLARKAAVNMMYIISAINYQISIHSLSE